MSSYTKGQLDAAVGMILMTNNAPDGGVPAEQKPVQTRVPPEPKPRDSTTGVALLTQPSFPDAKRAEGAPKKKSLTVAKPLPSEYVDSWFHHNVYGSEHPSLVKSPVRNTLSSTVGGASAKAAPARNATITNDKKRAREAVEASASAPEPLSAGTSRRVRSKQMEANANAGFASSAALSSSAPVDDTEDLKAQIREKIRALNRQLADLEEQKKKAEGLKRFASAANKEQMAARMSGAMSERLKYLDSARKLLPSSRKRALVAPTSLRSEDRNAQVQKARADATQKNVLDNRERGRKKAPLCTPLKSLTPIVDGGKFTFEESRDFKLNEDDDDETIPPPLKKMADWEKKLNCGQWSRLRELTDCIRCLGHCGAVHKKDKGCTAVQEIRRYKLKKAFMAIAREKAKNFKLLNKKSTKEERRQQARMLNMDTKSSASNMSKKQREIAKLMAKKRANQWTYYGQAV